jgi:hypothetical protein
VLRSLSLQGPSFGNFGTGAGIRCSGTNGLYLDHVWFRGILHGLACADSSFINANQCVAEYCHIGALVTTTLDESLWNSWTFYHNETDVSVSGAQKSFSIDGLTSISVGVDGLLVLCSGLVVRNILAHNDGRAASPNIVNIVGGHNRIAGVKATSYGLRGIFLQGSAATGNRISDLSLSGVTNGIVVSVAPSNVFRDLVITGATVGVSCDSAPYNRFDQYEIAGCATLVSLNLSETTLFTNGAP